MYSYTFNLGLIFTVFYYISCIVVFVLNCLCLFHLYDMFPQKKSIIKNDAFFDSKVFISLCLVH